MCGSNNRAVSCCAHASQGCACACNMHHMPSTSSEILHQIKRKPLLSLEFTQDCQQVALNLVQLAMAGGMK